MRRIVVAGCVFALLVTGGCSIDPAVSDTGYVGTWARGNPRIRSTIAIAKVGEEYRFRWGKRSADGRLKAVCDWSGKCTEWFDGKKAADYQFRVWKDATSGHLFVEAIETRSVPTDFTQRYTDELVVVADGKALMSYTVEKNGDTFEYGKGPNRTFEKVGDGVAYPPPALTAN